MNFTSRTITKVKCYPFWNRVHKQIYEYLFDLDITAVVVSKIEWLVPKDLKPESKYNQRIMNCVTKSLKLLIALITTQIFNSPTVAKLL